MTHDEELTLLEQVEKDQKNIASLLEVCKKLSSLCPSGEGLGGHAPLQAFLKLGVLARKAIAQAEAL